MAGALTRSRYDDGGYVDGAGTGAGGALSDATGAGTQPDATASQDGTDTAAGPGAIGALSAVMGSTGAYSVNPGDSGTSPLQNTREFATRDAAAAQKMDAIDRAMTILQSSQGNQTVNLPLLAAAGAMLGPTRTGTFGESIGNATRAAVPAIAEQRQLERQNALDLGNLGVAGLTAESEADLRRQQAALAELQVRGWGELTGQGQGNGAAPSAPPSSRSSAGGARLPSDLAAIANHTDQDYDLPSGFTSKILVAENSGPAAVSPKGAVGVGQFMPATAKQYGVDPTKTVQSIDAVGRMSADLLKHYDGNQTYAAMAYNWGQGNVDKWIEGGADPSKIPPETLRYIQPFLPQTTTASSMMPGRGMIPPGGSQTRETGPAPLLDPAAMAREYARLRTIPLEAAQTRAGQLFTALKGMEPPGMYLAANGQLYPRQGYLDTKSKEALAGKGLTENQDGSWSFPPGYVASEASEAGAVQKAKEENTQHVLRGTGSMLIGGNGQLIAQSPQPIDKYNPDTGRVERTWQYLAPNSGPAAAPQLEDRGAVGSAGGKATASGTTGQAIPTYPTGPSELEKVTMQHRAEALEKYGDVLQTNAQNSVQSNFLIDQMRRESGSWDMDKFSNWRGEGQAYLQAIGHSIGVETPDLNKPLGDWQAFNKNAMEIMRQTTRATSSRAAVQEMQMIQKALPQATMSKQGFSQIADQLQGANDYNVAKQAAADAWRKTHNGTLVDFEANFNANISPTAFLVHRMDTDTFKSMAANLQKTPEGRAELSRIVRQMQYGQKNGLFTAGQE